MLVLIWEMNGRTAWNGYKKERTYESGDERLEDRDRDDVVLYRNDFMKIAIEKDSGAYCVNGTK
jgi:hypothetical protein